MRPLNSYTLPVSKERLERIDRSSSPAHFGKMRNAVDFVAPIGTPVLAAAGGTVTFVRDDSYSGGPSPEYGYDSNFIVLAHPGGEYSRYDHLQHKSASVKVGDFVAAGQPIAKIGMTGFTYLPHLHFQVIVLTGPDIWRDFDTLPLPDF